MTTYTFPATLTPNSSTWGFASNTRGLVSPVTGAQQTIVRAGERWLVTLTFANLLPAQAQELAAFLVRLNGQEHRVLIEDHAWIRQGVGAGPADCDGVAAVGARSLNFRNGPNSQVGYLKAGDYFKVSNELKMCVADVDTSGTGTGTIDFLPRLRSATVDGEDIFLNAPLTGEFMLAEPELSWNAKPGFFRDFSFSLIEDVLS